MQYLVIEAAQDPTFAHDKKFAGAVIGCWIKDQTEKNAYLIAKGWIEERGWVVLELQDQHSVSEEDYKGHPEGKDCFDQALTDEEVFVFHTFQKHDEDEK